MQYLSKICLTIVFLGFGLNVQAGHLFTQASLNTPVNLTAGFGIDIPQQGLEGGSGSNVSYINVCGFDSGDALRVILPGYTQTFTFGSLPSGWNFNPLGSCQPDGTAAGEPDYIETNGATSTDDPALAALGLPTTFAWRLEAVSGAFTVHGYRLAQSTGTIDGTNSGTVNQSGVTPSGPATAIPVLGLPHLVLLILGLIGMVGARRRFLGSQQQAG
jgi:hypothetical protein